MIRELVLAIGPLTLAWAAVVYRLPVLWRSAETPGLRAHWFAHLALAVALAFLFAPFYLAFDAVVGVANLARLLAHASVLISAWCVQTYFAYLALPRDRARATSTRGGVLLLSALLLLGLFFHLANVGEDAIDFTGHFASAPFVLEYRLIFLAYLGWSMVILITLARRYAPLARARPALFLGLHLLALAGWVALAYVIHEGGWAVSRRLNLPYPVPQPEFWKEVLVAVSIGLLLIGATLPAWGPRAGVPAMYEWATRYMACRRLYPLWRDLCIGVPDVALVPPTPMIFDALAVRGMELRLTRRVIEIRDGRLALRTSVPPGVAENTRRQCRDARLSVHQEQPTVEAACLAAALEARKLGWYPTSPDVMPGAPGARDLGGEVAQLLRLAEAYRRSPIVKAVRTAVRRNETAQSLSALA
ncbi:MAG: hypothetical protein M3069_07945 [Chloroflexota bacterium]|nr:hypothetical protein [Chloroflexota bacterium]